MKVVFATSALKDYREFEQKDSKVFKIINRLFENIKETSFSGIGKPELLKHNWTGYWSRRITQEHRLVYKVTEDKILIAWLPDTSQ